MRTEYFQAYDKNEEAIMVGDSVIVDEPEFDDPWNSSFKGSVNAIYYTYIEVIDGEGEFFYPKFIQVEVDQEESF